MQRNMKLISLVAATLIGGTAGAMAQGYDRYGTAVEVQRGGVGYYAASPGVTYYSDSTYPGSTGWYGPMNGANHPAPSSTQGDVGPEGNNNGTLTGVYSRW